MMQKEEDGEAQEEDTFEESRRAAESRRCEDQISLWIRIRQDQEKNENENQRYARSMT